MASRHGSLIFCLVLFVLPKWLWIGSPRSLRKGHHISRRADEADGSQDLPSDEKETESQDWREFRARLVQQEAEDTEGAGITGINKISLKKAEKWAYESPIIEQGSILLSSPNDHFCINQQYFHKNVIFLVQHDSGYEGFTKGVILNRPTAFSTTDLESTLNLQDFSHQGVDDWNVWCGGDCQGINDRRGPAPVEYSVLHGLERLEKYGETITKGVYSINLDDAKELVASGRADKDDFLLLVGYCGWADGQLQSELDRQDTWTMASIDPSLLLGQLREEQADLRKRIAKAGQDDVFTADDVGDGLEMWERLFRALGPKYEKIVDKFKESGENEHSDDMLRRWINRCLIPRRYSTERAEPEEVVERALKSLKGEKEEATEGTVLRGSASAWLLGKPFEDERFDSRRFWPSQYLHKAVLLVIKIEKERDSQGPALLAVLNGPQIGESEEKKPVYWGGPQGNNYMYKVLEAPETSFEGSFQGFTILPPGMLDILLEARALEPSQATVAEVLAASVEERWTVAGGTLDTLEELRTSRTGDKQRRKWFKRFLDLVLPEPDDD